MKLSRFFTIAVAVGLAVAANASTASAGDPGCVGCASGHSGFGHGGPTPPASTLFKGSLLGKFQGIQKPKLPVFQAAPWYNYWPYDGHFLTPAPVNGQFYGPPMTGNFPVNPYFPGPGGAAGFGPIPGGPPPGFPMMMPPGGGR